ncbi:hypothetical protein F4859DRAFT_307410 [Xylaria cf. heliscus]|nr:hypothetical protein F4859DRAFT_307410 [Xylaria cf. heliscus]
MGSRQPTAYGATNPALYALDSALWQIPIDSSSNTKPLGPMLVQDIITAEELNRYVRERLPERLACLVVTSTSVIPGLVEPGNALLDFGGTSFTVVQICLADPIATGDSGSWVFVRGRLFRMIVAVPKTGGMQTSHDSADKGAVSIPSTEAISALEGQCWAYVIPIEDTFRSIAATLSTVVNLPDLRDWKIFLLEKQRRSWRWLPMSDGVLEEWLPRHLDVERLIAEKRASDLRSSQVEGISTAQATVTIHLDHQSRVLLHYSSGIYLETLESLLYLGDVCPLSPQLRAGFRRWSAGHRESRSHNLAAWASSIIV